MLQKEDALLQPAQLSATELHNRIRGLACGPKPKVPFVHQGQTDWLQIIQTEVHLQKDAQAPGTVLAIERERGILVKCKEDALWLVQVQPAGKKPMPGEAFANGRGIKTGDCVFINN